jgi:pimeloyl-ACP methyl ester carboxylesterase
VSRQAVPVDERRSTPVGWGPYRLQRPWIAATIAAVAGVFVTGLGAGIAVRSLMKTGLTWIGAVGLLTLVAGLALLGFACVVGWRATQRWQRLWFLPAAVLALLVIWPVAEGAALAYSPRAGLGSATPAARGLAYTSVTFRTTDGVRLSAWYIPATNGAAVVTVPGAGSNRTATLDQAVVLARHGYGVLMVDPRGQGRSGGRAMDAGWYGDRDVTAAVSFLQHQPGVDPNRIGVLGLSMGGEEAIGAAAAAPAIRAVVAEGATHRTAADKAGYLPGGIAGAIQRGIDRVTYATAELLSGAPRPATLRSAIARADQTQFLLIAGGSAVDEPEAVAYLRQAAPDRVRTWTVPSAAHTRGLVTAPTEWTSRVTAFLDAALRARS